MRVGVTGGVGAGKSTVTEMLATRGAFVIDADDVARDVIRPGSVTLSKLVDLFGAGILRTDGSLDRSRFADLIFGSEAARRTMEELVLPVIATEIGRREQTMPADAVVVVDVPLLVESGSANDYDAIIVVEAPYEVRLQRLERRGMRRDDAERRMRAQASDEDRRPFATWVIDNGDNPEHTRRQVDRIWTESLNRSL